MGFASAIMGGLMKASMMMNNVLLDTTTTTDTEGGGFDILKFLNNTANYLKQVGHYIMVLAGVILVIVAVVQIAKGFASGGRGQVNWVMSIACLLVGGMLIFGGWNLATGIASMGADTIEQLGTGEGIGDADSIGGGAGDAGGQSSFAPAAG